MIDGKKSSADYHLNRKKKQAVWPYEIMTTSLLRPLSGAPLNLLKSSESHAEVATPASEEAKGNQYLDSVRERHTDDEQLWNPKTHVSGPSNA